MLHVEKGVSGSFISLLYLSLEILHMQETWHLLLCLTYSIRKKKKEAKKFTVINLMTSSNGKSKFSDIHNKLSSPQQQKLQVLHTELNSLAL